jgi:hypothetical protein
MSEDYNGTGSSYWALKVFLILGLDEKHKYWEVNEEQLPVLEPKKFQKHSRMTLCRKEKHVVAFVNGQNCNNLIHSVSKYEKFCYSNLFGFSVSRSEYGINSGAYDSTLAISENGETYIARHGIGNFVNKEGLLYSKWIPFNSVEIESFIVPALPWHVRIHKIKTNRKISLQEGGFSIERKSHTFQEDKREIVETNNGVGITYGDIHSGIISLIGNGIPEVSLPAPNTNVLYPRTELPTLKWSLPSGEYVIVTAVLGDTDSHRNIQHFWSDVPEVNMDKTEIILKYNGLEEKIDIKSQYKVPSSVNNKIRIFKRKLKIILQKVKNV